MADIELHTKVEIEINNIKGFKHWVPNQVHVQGAHFMEVYKFDRQLTRFALNKQMNFEAKVTCNVKFIDEFQKLRTDASDRNVRDALRECTENESSLRRLNKRKTKSSDKAIASEIVSITIPAFEELPEKTMRVLWGVKKEPVFMELTKENLDYVVTRVKMDFDAGRMGRSRVKKSEAHAADDNCESDADDGNADGDGDDVDDRNTGDDDCDDSSVIDSGS